MARNLSAWQEGISSPGKNDKKENSQKVGLKKKDLEVLEKARTKSQPTKTPQNEKVSKRIFEEKTSKE